jgi:hypothetical protein
MEALKPVLAQKFWILLGLAMIMTLTGWWTATAEMLKKIKARREEIKKAFDSIPKDKIPRESWATDLNVLNEQQKKSIVSTRAKLWEKQLVKLMEWPKDVQPRNGYLGTFSNESKNEYKETYYEEEVTKVWKKLRPFELDGSGIVDYPIENMYDLLKRYPGGKAAQPTDEEMWNIKEDLLLLEALFQSIAAVNGGSDVARTVDMVHRIETLELRGGSAAKAKPVAPATASTSGGGMASTAGLPSYSAEFNPREEFGDDGSPSLTRRNAQTAIAGPAGGGGGRRVGAAMPSNLEWDEVKKLEKAGGQAPPAAAAANKGKPIERYISKSDMFKTRGFYLVVKMDHQKIPQLIAELTANDQSVWPVEILRVQMSRLHEDTTAIGTAPAGNMPVARRAPRMDDDMPMANPGGNAAAGNAELSEQRQVAEASLQKALSNPTIAEVAICGVFTLYQKVALEDAAAKPASPAPPATPAAPAASPGQQEPISPVAKTEAETTANDAKTTNDTDSTVDTNLEASAEATDQTTEMPADSVSPTDPNTPSDPNPDPVPVKGEKEEK